METAAKTNRLIIDAFSFCGFDRLHKKLNRHGFYQEIHPALIGESNIENFLRRVGDRLVVLAEQALAFRQTNILEQASEALASPVLPAHYQHIGKYYQALCVQKHGQGDNEKAAQLLNQLTNKAPAQYRLRAMTALAANRCNVDDYKSGLMLYQKTKLFALQSGLYDPYSVITAQRMIAVINSIAGNHKGALRILEDMFPLAHKMRLSHPQVYYDYLNSLAVELGEANRIAEAENVCQIVLASPFARAYPEWQETRDDLHLKAGRSSNSVAAFSFSASSIDNVVRLPAPQHNVAERPQGGLKAQPARVFSYMEWKKNNMAKEPNGDLRDKPAEQMTHKQLMMRILQLIVDEKLSDQELTEVLYSIEEVIDRRKTKS